MANTNDDLSAYVASFFPEYDVEVEGVGAALSPFKVRMTHKHDGHIHSANTSLNRDELIERLAVDVAKHDKVPTPDLLSEDESKEEAPIVEEHVPDPEIK